MPAQTRTYRIDPPGHPARLVRAPTKAQAVAHVAKDIAARVATQDDLIALCSAGTSVEDAGESKEPTT